jgi:hypothetical protein
MLHENKWCSAVTIYHEYAPLKRTHHFAQDEKSTPQTSVPGPHPAKLLLMAVSHQKKRAVEPEAEDPVVW